MVESLPAVWETQVRSLGREDTLEKEMATHSSILAMENPMDRGTWWAAVRGVAKSRTLLSADRGTWWAAVRGVAKSRTLLSAFTHSNTH